MDEILKKLSEQTGLTLETTRTAFGAILSFLKKHLPEPYSSQLMGLVPEAHQLVDAHEAAAPGMSTEPAGGLMGALTELATKLFGPKAGEATRLLATLHNSGLDHKQIEAFVPRVIELIKTHLPPDLVEKIVAMIPAARKTT